MSYLRVTDLTIRFGNRPPAVNSISFEVGERDRLGIIGQPERAWARLANPAANHWKRRF